MKARALCSALLLVAGCGKDAPGPAPAASEAPSASAAPADVPTASASGSMGFLVDVPPPPLPPASDMPEITPRCCTRDRAEGHYGPESGVHTAFVGDFLRKKDGKRLLFPDDLISDTKELFQHARSAGKTVKQERRLRVVGETDKVLSLEVLDTGETGSMKPFSHSSCKTISLRDGRTLKLEDAVGKDAAFSLSVKGRVAFDERNRKEDLYRFVLTSFAVLDDGKKLRFCNPRKDDALGTARLDVEVPIPQ